VLQLEQVKKASSS